MGTPLLSPPIAFFGLLIFLSVCAYFLSRLAFHRTTKRASGTEKSYACGEDIKDNRAQPDYSQFFPYAFFFTIAHVAALMVTTVPLESAKVLAMALVYISVVMMGLYILLRRQA